MGCEVDFNHLIMHKNITNLRYLQMFRFKLLIVNIHFLILQLVSQLQFNFYLDIYKFNESKDACMTPIITNSLAYSNFDMSSSLFLVLMTIIYIHFERKKV